MEDNTLESLEFQELSNFIGLKKKKKLRFPMDDVVLSENSYKENNDLTSSIQFSKEMSDNENDLSFNIKKKKKKKKINIEERSLSQIDSLDYISEDRIDILSLALHENDADAEYSYEDLLSRVYAIMREIDPKRDLESRKKLIMKPPQILRIGTKKTSFVNFVEICKLVHRLPQHLQSFLLVELGTSGSLDGNNQLIIKGRFEQRQIENVLRRYIKEYVTCHTCRSPDTVLQKDTRLYFLQCESCGSRCSVASVKSGFQAVTSKRAAMRAKAT